MRALLVSLFGLVLPLGAQDVSGASGVGLRVMTFNIRYANDSDGLHAWHHRRDLVAGVVLYHRPDVLGVQEALGRQVADLDERLRDYDSYGVGRDWPAGGESCTVYWRSDRLEALERETFWLSPTPDRPSRAWGAGLRRICTRVRFRDRDSGQTFQVFNTHFDHRSGEARERSSDLLRERAAALPVGEPVVVMGDFNFPEESQAYRNLIAPTVGDAPALVDATYASREPLYGPSGTFSGFGWGRGAVAGGRIDHIFVRGPLAVARHAVIGDTRDGRVPSDHRPVVADLRLGVPFEQPRLELRTLWRVRVDPESVGLDEGWMEPGFDDGGWRRAVAGEAWEALGLEEFREHDGIGWYRRSVRVPPSWEGRSAHLVWSGIADGYTLWVNGERVLSGGGPGVSSYQLPVAVRLPVSLLRAGGANQITFRVEDTGGDGGLLAPPPALVLDHGGSTAWAEAFAAVPLLDREIGPGGELDLELSAWGDGDGEEWIDARLSLERGDEDMETVTVTVSDGSGRVITTATTSARELSIEWQPGDDREIQLRVDPARTGRVVLVGRGVDPDGR